MERRDTVLALLALGLAPLASEAQQREKVARIGSLSPASASTDASNLGALQQRLRELGWIAGQNITMEDRFAEGRLDRLPKLAAELVRLKVDVIVTGSTSGA